MIKRASATRLRYSETSRRVYFPYRCAERSLSTVNNESSRCITACETLYDAARKTAVKRRSFTPNYDDADDDNDDGDDGGSKYIYSERSIRLEYCVFVCIRYTKGRVSQQLCGLA